MVRLDDIAIPARLPVIEPELRGDRGPDFGVTEMNVPLPEPGQTLFAFRASDEGKLQACIPLQVVAGDRVLREYYQSGVCFDCRGSSHRCARRRGMAERGQPFCDSTSTNLTCSSKFTAGYSPRLRTANWR